MFHQPPIKSHIAVKQLDTPFNSDNQSMKTAIARLTRGVYNVSRLSAIRYTKFSQSPSSRQALPTYPWDYDSACLSPTSSLILAKLQNWTRVLVRTASCDPADWMVGWSPNWMYSDTGQLPMFSQPQVQTVSWANVPFKGRLKQELQPCGNAISISLSLNGDCKGASSDACL